MSDEPEPDSGAAGEPPSPRDGVIARMTAEQFERWQLARRHAHEVAFEHSRACRQLNAAQQRLDAARAVVEATKANAAKGAERADEAEAHLQRTTQEILRDLGVWRPGARIDINDDGTIVDPTKIE